VPKKVAIPVLNSVTLTPHPDGYFLDTWMEGREMERFQFSDVQQVVDFAVEARRVALLSVGYDELLVTAGDVQVDDRLPLMNGGSVDSVDIEKKYAEIVPTSELDELVEYRHFTFKNSTANLSMKSDDRLTVLRRIQ
jgi:hypothetical protein